MFFEQLVEHVFISEVLQEGRRLLRPPGAGPDLFRHANVALEDAARQRRVERGGHRRHRAADAPEHPPTTHDLPADAGGYGQVDEVADAHGGAGERSADLARRFAEAAAASGDAEVAFATLDTPVGQTSVAAVGVTIIFLIMVTVAASRIRQRFLEQTRKAELAFWQLRQLVPRIER